MTADPKDLAALLGSRICHDLISPIGAIGNGLELIAMSGLGNTPELSLISDSVTNANARIRFYRVAFGQGTGQSLSRPEIIGILDGISSGSRMEIDWQPEGEVRRADAKLMFLLIQCCESAMPYGGRIVLSRDGSDWTVTATAAKLKPLGEIWTLLTDPQADQEITPALVQFGLVQPALDDAGRRLRLDLQPDTVRIAV